MVLMVVPNIIFDATAAECIVRIIANKVSRKVVATMELWRGSIFMDSWRGDGQWTLELNKTADVQENRAYTFFTHAWVKDYNDYWYHVVWVADLNGDGHDEYLTCRVEVV